jgi:1,4-dihydroxy-6-naphthoate synthase
MRRIVSLAVSTCPNDTFMFDAWVNGRLDAATPGVSCRLEDISALNELALAGEPDLVKVSVPVYARVQQHYHLLDAGGAMGRSCGPLIVARSSEVTRAALAEPSIMIAVPGRLTTAALLLGLYQPAARAPRCMRFDEIMPAVACGDVDAGVVIHEGRFTYQDYGLRAVADLGLWWEQSTGHPLPLGVIIAKKTLGRALCLRIEQAIRQSIAAAQAHPDAPLPFMRRHAGEMNDDVMRRHVALYVNDYSLSYGPAGRAAIGLLLQRAREVNRVD